MTAPDPTAQAKELLHSLEFYQGWRHWKTLEGPGEYLGQTPEDVAKVAAALDAARQQGREQAEQERDALRAENDTLREMIRTRQWVGHYGTCPWCYKTNEEGHTATCQTRHVLGRTQ